MSHYPGCISLQNPVRLLPEALALPGSFHDCYVHGVRWDSRRFSFAIDLDYILDWLEPRDRSEGYRFLVSRASLVFSNADSVTLALDWTGGALISQLYELRVDGSRNTLNGSVQSRYVLEFTEPEGQISLWSTGYEVALWTEPRESEFQSLDTD
jgi:hypothetical protein